MKSAIPKIPVRLIGGFLGSGKTTLIAKLIEVYAKDGLKVGVITNDQAEDLVDSHLLSSTGVSLKEVAGSCFCCDFNTFVSSSEELLESGVDLILAEPVGSCTDLRETVLNPLSHLHGQLFMVEPLSVLCDPLRIRAALGICDSPFPKPVQYIYSTQLQEADHIIINKSDLLSEEETKQLINRLDEQFPEKSKLVISATRGSGIHNLIELWKSHSSLNQPQVDVDYHLYAEGESMLGWLNASAQVDSSDIFAEKFQSFTNLIHEELTAKGHEVAHLKIRAQSNEDWLQSQSTNSSKRPQLFGNWNISRGKVDLIINARIEAPPSVIEKTFKNAFWETWPEGIVERVKSFKPSEPNPTHKPFLLKGEKEIS